MPVTVDDVRGGLSEYQEAFKAEQQKAVREFKVMACRLQRGEDIPAKAIAKVMKAAEKTPDDLAAEMNKAAGFLAKVATIEAARTRFQESETRCQRLADELAGFEQREKDLLELIVTLECDRHRCGNSSRLVNSENHLATTQAAEARKLLLEGAAADYGIEIPTGLPMPPTVRIGFMPLYLDWRINVERIAHQRLRAQANWNREEPKPVTASPVAQASLLPSPAPVHPVAEQVAPTSLQSDEPADATEDDAGQAAAVRYVPGGFLSDE